jgi:hypothetical protein
VYVADAAMLDAEREHVHNFVDVDIVAEVAFALGFG